MAFNINEFKTNIATNGGLLKSNRFAVMISKPNVVPASYTDLSSLQFYADSASVPGIALQTAEIRREGIGNLEKTPWGAAFTDISITFMIDQKTKIWNFFQVWMNAIYDFNMDSEGRPRTFFEMAYKDDYSTFVSINVYNEIDRGENSVITIDLVDAFPISISDMQLNWNGTDIMKLTVAFNFKSWNLRDSGKYDLNLESPQGSSLSNVDLRPNLNNVFSHSKAIPNQSNPTNSSQLI